MNEDKIIKYLPAIELVGRSENDNKGTIIDTETTGIGPDDEIVEFTALHFYFNDKFEITDIDSPVTLLNQPSFPIPEETTKYNGITNEMVEGHAIQKGQLDPILRDSMVVISHNAKFDRSYLEKDFHLADMVWGCSITDIDWQSKFFTSRSLDYIAFKYGFWFNAHRAEEDCLALLRILSLDGNLEELLTNTFEEQFRVNFEGTAFSEKDILKVNGCQWDGVNRVWFLPPNVATDELVTKIKGEISTGRAVKETIDMLGRYKTI